jgi:Flp pilus assembly protein TadG
MRHIHVGSTLLQWPRSFVRMIRRSNDGIAGVAGVEFALFAMILLLLAVSALEFGMGFYRKMQVYDAAQAGAAYVIKNGFVASSIATAVTSATTNSGITATPAASQACGCPTSSGITAATCGASCTDGTLAATYVTVSAQGSYTPIFSYPGLPSSFTFTSSAIVRIK